MKVILDCFKCGVTKESELRKAEFLSVVIPKGWAMLSAQNEGVTRWELFCDTCTKSVFTAGKGATK